MESTHNRPLHGLRTQSEISIQFDMWFWPNGELKSNLFPIYSFVFNKNIKSLI